MFRAMSTGKNRIVTLSGKAEYNIHNVRIRSKRPAVAPNVVL